MFSSYRAVNTLRLGYKDQPVNILYWEMPTVYSETHKKHINTLFQQNVQFWIFFNLLVHIVTIRI
jgi:hypothetical protein